MKNRPIDYFQLLSRVMPPEEINIIHILSSKNLSGRDRPNELQFPRQICKKRINDKGYSRRHKLAVKHKRNLQKT